MSQRWICFALAIAGVTCTAQAAEPKVDVRCWAVQVDHAGGEYSVPASPSPVALIAVGTVRNVAGGGEDETELVVERTLFGPRLSVVPLTKVKIPDPPGPRIYSLAYPPKATEFKLTVNEYYTFDRIFPLSQEPALKALARAHLDYLVLSSDAIFIARPRSPPVPTGRRVTERVTKRVRAELDDVESKVKVEVEVERLVSGSGPEKGSLVRVSGHNDSLPAGEACLYFCALPDPDSEEDAEHDEEQGTEQQQHLKLPHYSLRARWPVAELAVVEETLKRRSLFPIQESISKSGRVERWREITFQGARAEAIALLGTRYDAVERLATDRLIADGKLAIPEVAAAVERNLFRTKLDCENQFGQQEHLIQVLATLEEHRTDGEIVRLIGKVLDKVQAGEAFPFDESPRGHKRPPPRQYNDLFLDENHSLAWLVQTLNERDAARLFGERLLKLRDLSRYGWKDEIQFVVDNRHLEDQLNLMALAPRMAKLTPVRWQGGFRSDHRYEYKVAFSPDDQYCVVVGDTGKVWRTSDWTLAGEFDEDESASAVEFSPDNRFLYVATVTPDFDDAVIEKWAWESGQIVERFRGHASAVNAMALSPDGKRLLSSEHEIGGKSTTLWDTTSGQALARFDAIWSRLAWHPAGGWFLGKNYDDEGARRDKAWHRVDLETKQKSPVNLRWIDARFSQDGKSLFCLEPHPKTRDATEGGDDGSASDNEPHPNPILRRRSTAAGFVLELERPLDYPAERLQLVGEGTQLAVIAADEVELVSTTDLSESVRSKAESPIQDDGGWSDRKEPPVVSHEARWFVAPVQSGTPELHDVRTGRRLPLGAAHSSPIHSVSFLEQGTELKTEGEDGVICRWSVADGKLIERIGDPVTGKHRRWGRRSSEVHVSEDGSVRYLISGERVARYGPPQVFTIETAPPATGAPAEEEDWEDAARVPQEGRQKLGEVHLKWDQWNPLGLVPDGRNFFIGAHIFNRQNLALVSASNVSGGIEEVEFSADGSRFALVTSDPSAQKIGAVTIPNDLITWWFRVHETKSGRTLLAVEIPGPGAACVALNHRGDVAAVVGKDSSITVWPVPGDE